MEPTLPKFVIILNEKVWKVQAFQEGVTAIDLLRATNALRAELLESIGKNPDATLPVVAPVATREVSA